MTRATKYAVANLALVAAAFAAYRYYGATQAQSRSGSQSAKLILTGICLYIVIAVVVTVRAYWRQGRYDVAGESSNASDAGAYGLLGANRLKHVTVPLKVTDAEWTDLMATGTLELPPERFNMPIHDKDAVQVTSGSGVYTRALTATVTCIDGVNQRVTIQVTKH